MASRITAPLAIEWLLRVGIGGLFIFAGALKVWNGEAFALDVHHYELTPWRLSVLIAAYLPWVEIIAGLALIARRLVPGALALLTGLMLVFTAVIGSAWWRGLDISCGCFGRQKTATDFPALMLRDAAILTALAVLIALEARRVRAFDNPSRGVK